MNIDTQSDLATPIARTRRYDRSRGFTRGAFVVVPEWPNIAGTNEGQYIPAWMRESADDAIADCASCDEVYAEAYDALEQPLTR